VCVCVCVCVCVQVTIKVTLKVDTNGILSVHAKVDQTGQELDMTVTSNKGRMSQEMLEVSVACTCIDMGHMSQEMLEVSFSEIPQTLNRMSQEMLEVSGDA
jgi:hypothetical protein